MSLLDRFRRSGHHPTTDRQDEVTPPPTRADGSQTTDVAASPTHGSPGTDGVDNPVPAGDTGRGHLGEWLDIPVEHVSDHPDVIERIYAADLDGVSIRGVFSPQEVEAAVQRLQVFSDEFRDHGTTIMFGTALVGAADDRSDYFAGAPTINDRIDGIFDRDFTRRVAGVLSALGGGRPALVPVESGQSYVPATVRTLPPGRGVMHAHTANEFCNSWGSYDHLREIAVMWNSLSYFVVAQAPDSGGNLVLYDLMWDDTPGDVLEASMGPERDAMLERFGTVATDLAEGDMILFTGGRIWHRVEPVEGQRERVTIGGFAALSRDDEHVYFWS